MQKLPNWLTSKELRDAVNSRTPFYIPNAVPTLNYKWDDVIELINMDKQLTRYMKAGGFLVHFLNDKFQSIVDLAEQLHQALMDQLGGEGEEGGEEELGDDFGDENDEMLGDSVVSEPDPKPLGGHGDRSHPAAGNTGAGSNKVSSSKTSSPDGGSAHGGDVKEDPDPKALGGHGDRSHPDAGNVSAGSNKVKNTGKAIGD